MAEDIPRGRCQGGQAPLAPQQDGAKAALDLIEQSRETSWDRPTVAGQLFLGRVLTPLLVPYATQSAEDAAIGDRFVTELEAFLRAYVDADAIDRTGEMPAEVIQGLARLGCFGMKIPKEYGGLGLSQVNYNRAIALVASYCGSTAVWLSAHQSIGVPQPLKLFGTDEQKHQYLPRLARGAISAFALTEPDVGSDPAKMSTTATPVDNGAAYLITGEKLWCTNGPVAELLVVMAKTPDRVIGGKTRQQITAFIVEAKSPGIEVVHRCQFMGIRGIQNGLLRFTNVRVPKENIVWGPGRGLKLALMTLNTGRLTLPAACVGSAKLMLRITRQWAEERQQWGGPIGRHEAVAAKIGWMTSHLFAMEAVTWLASAWADRGDLDIRIEAAMAKLFCSETAWTICDETLQIRGGRGYETADSLKGRGEAPIPVERAFRDMRINRIIEGTSEVMHLFIAREALDPHIRRAFDVILPGRRLGQRVSTALRAGLFYAGWYPRQWLPTLGHTPAAIPAPLHGHWRFVQAASRRLARTLFHAMLRYQQRLEKRQLVLFRLVEVGVDLFAMAATISRASWLLKNDEGPLTRHPLPRGERERVPLGDPPHPLPLGERDGVRGEGDPVALADLFCLEARRRIEVRLAQPDLPTDRANDRVARDVLAGRYAWLEQGIVE